MTEPTELPSSNRRDFLKTTGSVTAASVLAGVAIPRVHSAVDDMTQIAIVGAGGRGTGAADNALSVPSDIARNKLVAMADVSTAKMDQQLQGPEEKAQGQRGRAGRSPLHRF